MRKSKIIRYICLITALVLLVSFSCVVFGDTGNHTDYYDGDSGSSSDGGLIELLFWLLFSSLPWPLKLIVIVGIIAFIIFTKKTKKGKEFSSTLNRLNSTSSSNTGYAVQDNTTKIESAIRKNDVNFSVGKFLGWSEEVFMTIQQAWTTRDWDKIRPFEKEELYRKHQLQLQEYINSGTINIVERVNVNQTYLYKYVRDNEYEYLTVYLQARMNDYIVDENTKQVVRGNREKEYHNKYLLTFMRKTGVLTDAATSNMSTHQCPHCGAPLAITSAGKCEYCDTIVTTGEHDWVLSDLDSVKKDSNLGQGGVFIK